MWCMVALGQGLAPVSVAAKWQKRWQSAGLVCKGQSTLSQGKVLLQDQKQWSTVVMYTKLCHL